MDRLEELSWFVGVNFIDVSRVVAEVTLNPSSSQTMFLAKARAISHSLKPLMSSHSKFGGPEALALLGRSTAAIHELEPSSAHEAGVVECLLKCVEAATRDCKNASSQHVIKRTTGRRGTSKGSKLTEIEEREDADFTMRFCTPIPVQTPSIPSSQVDNQMEALKLRPPKSHSSQIAIDETSQSPQGSADAAFQRSLAKESAMLTASLNSSLDATLQVEARMSEVTGLLESFTTLLAEQSSTIADLERTAEEATDNITDGTLHIISAKRRYDASAYRIPLYILFMAGLLMFLHLINP